MVPEHAPRVPGRCWPRDAGRQPRVRHCYVDLGLASASAAEGADTLDFGKFEPLAALLQDTPTNKLMPVLVDKLKNGTELRELVAAGAAGERPRVRRSALRRLSHVHGAGSGVRDGDRTARSPAPAPGAEGALPERDPHSGGGRARKKEVLHPVKPTPVPEGKVGGEVLQELTRKNDPNAAEGVFATLAKDGAEDAFNHVMYCVEDDVNVHRVVLAWRAWAMLDFTGKEHAHTPAPPVGPVLLQREPGWPVSRHSDTVAEADGPAQTGREETRHPRR